MKKIIIIVILCVLFSGCSTFFSDVTEIEAVNLQNGVKIVLPKDSKDADIIIDAVNKKNKTDEDITSLLSYEIILKKENDEEVYKLYFDLDNQTAYLAQDKTVFKIRDNIAKQLFLSDAI